MRGFELAEIIETVTKQTIKARVSNRQFSDPKKVAFL
jgi:hypothetical protein